MLLDTHALLWLATDDVRLGEDARRLITSGVRVHYSSVSISEIAIKHMLGRIGLPGADRFPAVFDEMGLAELPFTSRHAAALLAEPEPVRHDPFDRFLLAQATVERMPLLTADAVLLSLGHPDIQDARD